MRFLFLLDQFFWYLQKVCTLILVIWMIRRWWKVYNIKKQISLEESKEEKQLKRGV